MKFDPFKLTENIPIDSLRRRALDTVLSVGIPFNLGLGLHIVELNPCAIRVESPPRFFRKNHVGGAHACALATMGEYAAGLLIAQHFPVSEFRVIIQKLEIEYHKQGRGKLNVESQAPTAYPEIETDGTFIEMRTEITNSDRDLVAECKTRWQIKRWDDVRSKKA